MLSSSMKIRIRRYADALETKCFVVLNSYSYSIDVLDMNPDHSTQGVGTQLEKAMSRRVEELMVHEILKEG